MAAKKAAAYSNEPAASDIDKVRLLVGDTDCADPLLSDNEINWLISETGDITSAAAMAAKSIAGKFARKFTFATGRVRKELSAVFEHYIELEKNLRDLAAAGGIGSGGVPSVAPIFTALTRDARITDAQDPNKEQPFAEVGEFDNPRAPRGPQGGRNENPFGTP